MALGNLGPEDPERIGGFEIKAVVGRGGSGKVYLGLDPHGNAAAVKQLLVKRDLNDATSRERFLREIRTMGRIDSALVPRLADFDELCDPPWLATPYIPGPSLLEALGRGPLPAGFTWSLAGALCSALDTIHRAGALHRDLKPSNVMIARDRFVVIDLGLTRSVDGSDPGVTAVWISAGTPGYMSPEQIKALKDAEKPADVLSLAATVYHAATGRAPFQEQLSGGFPHTSGPDGPARPTYPDGLPSRLREFLRRGLELDHTRRASLAELMWLLPSDLETGFAETVPIPVRQAQLVLELDLKRRGGFTYPLHTPDPQRDLTTVMERTREGALHNAARIAAEARAAGGTGDGAIVTLRLARAAGVAALTEAEARAQYEAARAALPPATAADQILSGPLGRLAAAFSRDQLDSAIVVELCAEHCAVWEFTAGPTPPREHRIPWTTLLDAKVRIGKSPDESGDHPGARSVAGQGNPDSPDPADEHPTTPDLAHGDLLQLLLLGGKNAVPRGALRRFTPWLGNHELARRAATAVRTAVDRIVARSAAEQAAQAGERPKTPPLPPAPPLLTVVVRRPGWRLLELVGDNLAPGPGRPHLTGPQKLPKVFSQLLDLQPLPYPVGLATAEVDERTGAVTLRFLELFPAGTAPRGPDSRRTVPLELPRQVPDDGVLLPLVSRRTEHPYGWDLIRTGRIGVPAPAGVELTVTLLGTAHAALATPAAPHGLPADPVGWTEIRAMVPHSLLPPEGAADGPLDLVVAVERGSFDGDIEMRRRFAVSLLDRAAQLRPEPGALRTAVLDYGDHLFVSREFERLAPAERRRHDPEVCWSGFGPARRSTDVVLALTAKPIEHDYAAPVEEALAHLVTAGWNPGAQHVLVIVGGRPPHQPQWRSEIFNEALQCTNNVDWQATLNVLVNQYNLICVGVIEPWDAHLPGDNPKPHIDRQVLKGWKDVVGGRYVDLPWADPSAVLATAGVLPGARAPRKPATLPLARPARPAGPGGHTEVFPTGGAQ